VNYFYSFFNESFKLYIIITQIIDSNIDNIVKARAKQSTCRGGPAWQKTANKTVLYWNGMTDTELVHTQEEELVRHAKSENLLLSGEWPANGTIKQMIIWTKISNNKSYW